jgi:non-homologous end joining protein Ku
LEIKQFLKKEEIDFALEKPYFVAPENEEQAKTSSVAEP